MTGLAEPHPTPERAAAALESAGLNPYLLLQTDAIAPTAYKEVGLSVARNRFVLLSLEDVPVPSLGGEHCEALVALALRVAAGWGLTWRGSVQVSFGGEVAYRPGDDPDETGLHLHDAILALHHAHQSFRQRVLNAAWRGLPISAPPQAA